MTHHMTIMKYVSMTFYFEIIHSRKTLMIEITNTLGINSLTKE